MTGLWAIQVRQEIPGCSKFSGALQNWMLGVQIVGRAEAKVQSMGMSLGSSCDRVLAASFKLSILVEKASTAI